MGLFSWNEYYWSNFQGSFLDTLKVGNFIFCASFSKCKVMNLKNEPLFWVSRYLKILFVKINLARCFNWVSALLRMFSNRMSAHWFRWKYQRKRCSSLEKNAANCPSDFQKNSLWKVSILITVVIYFHFVNCLRSKFYSLKLFYVLRKVFRYKKVGWTKGR